MTQASKPIDITKTFIPGDPNAFPNNLVFNAGEDQPADRNPILAYEGWNFLPTNYGVKSYFGTTGELNVDALTSNVDWVLLYQKKTLQNFLIVLADDGIWTKDSSVIGAWVHEVTLAVPAPGIHLDWTWCVIGEDFFAYRQAGAAVYKISPYPGYWIPDDPVPNVQFFVDIADVTGTIPAGTYTYYVAYKELITGHIAIHGEGVIVTVPTLGDTVDLSWIAPRGSVDEYTVYRVNGAGVIEYRETNSALLLFTDTGAGWGVNTLPVAGAVQYTAYQVQTKTPNTLNMAGQLGIFKGGSRLGFWDSDNSFAWSGLDNKFDFVPSLRTLANTGHKFDDVIGKVVTVKQSKENFIIYSTKSIVFIQRNITEAFIWKSIPITNKTGIAYPREVTTGTIDTEHFAWTGMGLMRIEDNNYEIIVPGVTDFLKESKDPIYLHLLQNRYLFLALINPDYVYGKISFQTEVVPALILDFQPAFNAAENPTEDPCQTYTSVTKSSDKIWVYNANEALWNSLTKAVGGTGLGYPVDKDVPRFIGQYKRHLPSNCIDEGLKVLPTIIISPGDDTIGSITIHYTNNLGGITSDQVGMTDQQLPGLLNILSSAVDIQGTFNFSNAGTTVNMTNPNVGFTFENATQDWYAETRYIKEFIKSVVGVTFSLNNAGANVLTQNIPFLNAAIPLYLDNIAGNDAKSIMDNPGFRDGAITAPLQGVLCIFPVEYYPSKLFSNVNYDYFMLVQHVKKLAVIYYKMVSLSVAYTDIPGQGQSSTLWTRKAEVRVEYINVPECSPNKLSQPGNYSNTYLNFLSAAPLDRLYKVAKMYIQDFIRYDLAGNSSISPTPPPASPTFNDDFCPIDSGVDDLVLGAIYGGFNTTTGKVCGNSPQTVGTVFTNQPGIVIPATSFLLQQGSPAPLYPTFEGALVYDLQLKKWGKYKGQFKELLDYSPINNIATGIVPYEVFGVEGAALKPTGKIASFDEAPNDSLIKYGKIGYTRAGFTDVEEIIANFRRGSTGTLGITASLDGRSEEVALTSSTVFTNTMSVTHPGDVSAKWISITLTGFFDLQYLEFKGHRKSRR